MAPNKKNAPKRAYRKRNYTKRRASSKPSKAFVKKVQSVVHKDVETKQAYTKLDLTAFNSPISLTADVMPLLPNITQGIQDNNRIGDQIRAQSLTLRGHMIMAQGYSTTVSSTRIAVRMMIVQPKAFTGYDGIIANATNWLPTLLKKGGTTVGFTGVVSDLYAPINTDAITKYMDKIYYLDIPYYYNFNGATSTNVVATQDLHNTVKLFSHTIKLRNKCLKYDTTVATGSQPTNYCPCLLLGYAHLDGSAPDVVNTQVSLAWDTVLNYEDA